MWRTIATFQKNIIIFLKLKKKKRYAVRYSRTYRWPIHSTNLTQIRTAGEIKGRNRNEESHVRERERKRDQLIFSQKREFQILIREGCDSCSFNWENFFWGSKFR